MLEAGRGAIVGDYLQCGVRSSTAGCAAAAYDASSGLPTGDAPRTLSWWMRLPASPTPDGGVIGYGVPGSRSPFAYSLFSGGKATIEMWGPTLSDSDTSITPTLGSAAFEHFATVYDGAGSVRFYKNGVASANTMSVISAATVASGQLAVGSEVDGNEGVEGDFSDVQIYDSALDAGGIGLLHSLGRLGAISLASSPYLQPPSPPPLALPFFPPPPSVPPPLTLSGLVAWWRLDSSAGL